jgi:hypothetical protein
VATAPQIQIVMATIGTWSCASEIRSGANTALRAMASQRPPTATAVGSSRPVRWSRWATSVLGVWTSVAVMRYHLRSNALASATSWRRHACAVTAIWPCRRPGRKGRSSLAVAVHRAVGRWASAASGTGCPPEDAAQALVGGVVVSPGDLAADHAGPLAVSGVVDAVKDEGAQRAHCRWRPCPYGARALGSQTRGRGGGARRPQRLPPPEVPPQARAAVPPHPPYLAGARAVGLVPRRARSFQMLVLGRRSLSHQAG